MTRRTGLRVRIHPSEKKLIVEDAGVRLELDFAAARRLADDMGHLLWMFDPLRSR